MIRYIPWNPFSIGSVRGAAACLAIGLYRRSWRVTLNKQTIFAAVCVMATSFLFMAANQLTTAANAIVLQYTAPAYVIVMTLIKGGERPRALDLITVALTFAGITLFFFDQLDAGALLGNLLSLLSGVTFACVFFMNSLPEVDPFETSFLGLGMSALFLPVLFFDQAVLTSGMTPVALMLIMGVFQLGLAYIMFSKGIKKTGAVTASIISTLEPVLNPVWVFLAVGERPGMLAIVGAVVVIGAITGYNLKVSSVREA